MHGVWYPARLIRNHADFLKPFNAGAENAPHFRALHPTAVILLPGPVAGEGRKALRACRGGNGWSGVRQDGAEGQVSKARSGGH